MESRECHFQITFLLCSRFSEVETYFPFLFSGQDERTMKESGSLKVFSLGDWVLRLACWGCGPALSTGIWILSVSITLLIPFSSTFDLPNSVLTVDLVFHYFFLGHTTYNRYILVVESGIERRA